MICLKCGKDPFVFRDNGRLISYACECGHREGYVDNWKEKTCKLEAKMKPVIKYE